MVSGTFNHFPQLAVTTFAFSSVCILLLAEYHNISDWLFIILLMFYGLDFLSLSLSLALADRMS